MGVEFVRVLPETHAPSLTNVFSECAPNDDVVSNHNNFHRSLIHLTTLHLLSFASFGSKLRYHICLFSFKEGGREGKRESVEGEKERERETKFCVYANTILCGCILTYSMEQSPS